MKCPYCRKELGSLFKGRQRCFYCKNKFLVKERFYRGQVKRYVSRWPRVVRVRGFSRWNPRAKRYIQVASYKRSKPKREYFVLRN